MSSLLVCYHAKPSVDLDNKCHPYLYVIMPNQVWTWTTSVILTCMLSCQTKCGPGQQVSPLFVCYHAKPSVDLDNKCHPYLYVIMPNQVWTWTTSVIPTCMLSCQTKCGPGQQVSPLLVCYHACMLLCQTKCGPGQQVSSLLVCYHISVFARWQVFFLMRG